jgi:hypothetical protein
MSNHDDEIIALGKLLCEQGAALLQLGRRLSVRSAETDRAGSARSTSPNTRPASYAIHGTFDVAHLAGSAIGDGRRRITVNAVRLPISSSNEVSGYFRGRTPDATLGSTGSDSANPEVSASFRGTSSDEAVRRITADAVYAHAPNGEIFGQSKKKDGI